MHHRARQGLDRWSSAPLGYQRALHHGPQSRPSLVVWGAALPLSVFSLGHQVATRREPPAEGQMLAVGVMDVGKAAAAVAGDHHPGAHARPRAHTRRC